MPPSDPQRTAAHLLDVLSTSGLQPELGIVLGSAFGGVAEAVVASASLSFDELPGFAPTSVAGHAGRLILGTLAERPVAVLAGRTHFYEGHDLEVVTFPIRVLAGIGIRTVLLTNAAGGIHPAFAPGEFVAVTDHLNFQGVHPLRGPAPGPWFVDLTDTYSPRLRQSLHQAARAEGILLHEGVYAAVSGPSFETPAEVRALSLLGADLVGMSTVPEAIVARQCGLEVGALSCVTNRAAGLGDRISHQEVIELGALRSPVARRLIQRFAQWYEPPSPA